jgi:hypothetical protein
MHARHTASLGRSPVTWFGSICSTLGMLLQLTVDMSGKIAFAWPSTDDCCTGFGWFNVRGFLETRVRLCNHMMRLTLCVQRAAATMAARPPLRSGAYARCTWTCAVHVMNNAAPTTTRFPVAPSVAGMAMTLAARCGHDMGHIIASRSTLHAAWYMRAGLPCSVVESAMMG